MSADVQIHDQRLRGREVRWIELTRAAKSNALSVALLRQATDAVTEAPERAIFVSSRGRTFSAGLDLEEMLELGSAARPLRALAALYDALVKHPSPTACLVEHKAVAGGIGLALCADAVVMSCHAWFRLPAEHLYRPLAEVLLPIVQARRGITEPEFARWYGTKRTAAELAAGGHIDRVLHGDASRSMTGRLKRAAVDVLIDKGVYPAADLDDRIDAGVRAEQKKRARRAIEASRARPFHLAVQRHLGLIKRDPRAVFVVHGRNARARKAMFSFLRALELRPLSWKAMVRETGQASPYVGHVLAAGFALAQATVVLMTGDDRARLAKQHQRKKDPKYERKLSPQARPNVLIEAGMALALDEKRTILVEFGRLRPASDLLGRVTLQMDDGRAQRRALVSRLRQAGCALEEDGDRWRRAGNFGRV